MGAMGRQNAASWTRYAAASRRKGLLFFENGSRPSPKYCTCRPAPTCILVEDSSARLAKRGIACQGLQNVDRNRHAALLVQREQRNGWQVGSTSETCSEWRNFGTALN